MQKFFALILFLFIPVFASYGDVDTNQYSSTNFVTNIVIGIPIVKTVTTQSSSVPKNYAITIGWSPSLSRAALVAGYAVLISQDNVTWPRLVDASSNMFAVVSNLLSRASNYFAVVAYNSNGNQSPPYEITNYLQSTYSTTLFTMTYSNQYSATNIYEQLISTNITNMVLFSNVVTFTQPICYLSWTPPDAGSHQYVVVWATNFAIPNYWHVLTNYVTTNINTIVIADTNIVLQKFYGLIIKS